MGQKEVVIGRAAYNVLEAAQADRDMVPEATLLLLHLHEQGEITKGEQHHPDTEVEAYVGEWVVKVVMRDRTLKIIPSTGEVKRYYGDPRHL
jgi:hypothetical protein